MTQKQLILIAQMLNAILNDGPFAAPYISFGANVGQCFFCRAIGQVQSNFEIIYVHTDACPHTLNARLQASLQNEDAQP